MTNKHHNNGQQKSQRKTQTARLHWKPPRV